MSFELLLGLIIILTIFTIERSYRSYYLKKEIQRLREAAKIFEIDHEKFSMEVNRIASQDFKAEDYDPLTQLVSKKTFDKALSQLIQQSKRFGSSFALLTLKIDDFNQINNTYSTEIGDKILIEFSKRIKSTIRQVDTLTRYAGNMFLLLMPNLSTPETAVYGAQRLLDHSILPFNIDGKIIKLTACVGIVLYPFDTEDEKKLLQYSEEALNEARKSGKNLFQFYQKETQVLGQRELKLKQLITSEKFLDHLSLDYLPYINTSTHEKVCLKVDCYLNHPELGNIPFVGFYQIMQNAKKVLEFYEEMIRKAVIYFKQLEKHSNPPKQLLLIFTLKEIQNPEFVTRICRLIKSLEISPQKIIFEITDNFERIDSDKFTQALTVLQKEGFLVAIGILILGHLSVQKIHNLPIQYLKIDNRLIKNVENYSESQSILERLILIANKMELGVMTDGVEKLEQKQILQQLGCYVMQGNIISKEEIAT